MVMLLELLMIDVVNSELVSVLVAVFVTVAVLEPL